MSAAELAQYRLQQIRAIENQQVLEKTNVELKKQLEALKGADQTKDVKEKLIALAQGVKSWLSKMRLELEQTKGFCELQNNQILFLHQTIQDTLKNMAGAASSQSGDVARLQNENLDLAKQLREAKAALKESQKSCSTLTEKNKKLVTDYADSERDRSAMAETVTFLQEQLESRTVAFKELQSSHDAAQMEIIHLKKKIAKLEAAGGEALNAAYEAQRAAAAESAMLIEELRRENEDHRSNIINLKLHIERLTTAISGNKSHFAKFVELKTENAVLHNHLNTVLGSDNAVSKQQIQQKVKQVQQKQGVVSSSDQQLQQQQHVPNPTSSVAIPGMSKSALNAVDPSLAEYQTSINSFIAKSAVVGGGGAGKNRLPASGLKPNQPKQQQQQQQHNPAAVINSARGGYVSGNVTTSNSSSGNTSPRYSTSMDDVGLQLTGNGPQGGTKPGATGSGGIAGGGDGGGGGGMFPRVALLSNNSNGSNTNTNNIRRPSPIARNDGAAIGVNVAGNDVATADPGGSGYRSNGGIVGIGDDIILQHALQHQQMQQQQQPPTIPQSGLRKQSSKVRSTSRTASSLHV